VVFPQRVTQASTRSPLKLNIKSLVGRKMALTTGPLGGDCVQGYGDDVDLAEAPGPAGDRSLMLEQLLSERWSCRAFEDREVPRPVIE